MINRVFQLRAVPSLSAVFPGSTAGLVLLTCLLCGCGSGEPEKVTGKVVIQVTSGGNAVTAGAVQLVAASEGRGAFGQLGEDGSVTLENVEAGRYTVTVIPPAPLDPDPENPAPPVDYSHIPDAVRDQTTSPLKAEVKEGDNSFTFELVH